MDANDPMSGKSTTNLSYEAIEEVNVKTAGFEAEFGSSRTAQMQVVTKSGGNEFSGEPRSSSSSRTSGTGATSRAVRRRN
jgi:hypothetical protein